jgi:lysyl-tRNA synthetase class 2
MTDLEFAIAPEVSDRFSEVSVGMFAVDLNADQLGAAQTTALVRDAHDALRIRLATNDGLTRDPRIADWRAIIGRGGIKPSTFRSSVEQLGRRILKDPGFATPLPIVTAYCAISARHLAPLGGYDLARLPSSSITLRLWQPGDTYDPLGGNPVDLPTTSDLVVYGCGPTVMCYAWNVRDSRVTCLVPGTQRAVFFGEAATLRQRDACRAALTELAAWLGAQGARVGAIGFASAEAPRAIIARP